MRIVINKIHRLWGWTPYAVWALRNAGARLVAYVLMGALALVLVACGSKPLHVPTPAGGPGTSSATGGSSPANVGKREAATTGSAAGASEVLPSKNAAAEADKPTPAKPDPQAAAVQPLPERRTARIGLALGGGAARGFAHVGVIQVLEEAGLQPQVVTGTSAGSLVAALYASGKNSQELRRVADTMQEAEITDWMMPILNRGALRGEALAKYVNAQVGGKSIEQMKIALGIVATDLHSGEAVTFRLGNTGSAVRASSAVPAVFQPVRIAGREYVDGGLVAPVPVKQARDMGANFVIAVDISSDPEGNPAADTFQILMQTFTIMGKSINTLALREAELVVRPSLSGVKSADFGARRRSIEAGRSAMQALLPQLRKRLAAFEAGQ